MWVTPCLSLFVAGFTPGEVNFREKEDMYDKIIQLKKVKQTQNEYFVCYAFSQINTLREAPLSIRVMVSLS